MIYLYLVSMFLVGIIIGFFFGRAQERRTLRAYFYAEKQLKAFDDHVENEITLPDLVAKYEDRIPGFASMATGLGISKEEFAKALSTTSFSTNPLHVDPDTGVAYASLFELGPDESVRVDPDTGKIQHLNSTGKVINECYPFDRNAAVSGSFEVLPPGVQIQKGETRDRTGKIIKHPWDQ